MIIQREIWRGKTVSKLPDLPTIGSELSFTNPPRGRDESSTVFIFPFQKTEPNTGFEGETEYKSGRLTYPPSTPPSEHPEREREEMGRSPYCDESGLKKGPWTPEEDQKLDEYIQKNGHGSWRALPKLAGLNRCGKSCRLRWTYYLRPDIKRGKFSQEEEQTILNLHSILGNKWSAIATRLPGRTDNEIKNFWHTHLEKKLIQMGIDPMTHRPRTNIFSSLPHLIALANLEELIETHTWEEQAMGLQTEAAQMAKLQYLLQPQPPNSMAPNNLSNNNNIDQITYDNVLNSLSSMKDGQILSASQFGNLDHKSIPFAHMPDFQPVALPDGGEIVQLESLEQKPLVDFDATDNRAYQSDVRVSNSKNNGTGEVSKRLRITESALRLADSTTGISSTDSDAPDNGAHLMRAYMSGPIMFNSEKNDAREELNGECLTKSVLSLDDSTKRKSLPDFDATENKAYQSGHGVSLSENFFWGKALKRECSAKSILELKDLQQHCGGTRGDAAKSFSAIHTTHSLAQKSFKVLETLPTQEQPYDCVPLLSLGRLSLVGSVKEEKSPDLPRVMQIKGVEQSVTKFPKYIGGLTAQSASSSRWPVGSSDGGHLVLLDPLEQSTKNVAHVARADQCSPTVALPKKKMLRTLKKKCRLMSTIFGIHQQHSGRKCEGSVKSFGATRNCRKRGINRVSTVKRIHDQYGIRQWPFRQKWATRKGYSLRDKRPLEVSSLSMDEILGSRFPFIHMSQFARSLPRRLALRGGSNVVGPIALSSSDFAATNNRAHHVQQDQSGSTASLYERKNTRETSDRRGIMSLCRVENLQQHFGCKHKDAVNRLGGNVSMFKSTCGQHRVWWPCQTKSNDSLAWKSIEILDSLPLSEKKMVRKTLKRKCKTMSVLSSEDHQQHVDKRWDDPVKSLGTKRICRQVLPCVTTVTCIRRQHGIHRWLIQQDQATAKGYSLEGQRPVVVISLSMGWKLVSRLQLIYLSWHVRYTPRSSALPGAGEIVGRIALSSSEFAATNNGAELIRQDQRGSIASHSENNRMRETTTGKGINSSISLEDLLQCSGRKRKDAADGLGVSVSKFKRVCRQHGIQRWGKHIGSNVIWKPPDPHERNTSPTCMTLSSHGHTEMENQVVGHLHEPNEHQSDSSDETFVARILESPTFHDACVGNCLDIESEEAARGQQTDQSTAPQTDQSTLYAPHLERHGCGSSYGIEVPTCSDPASTQPMSTISHPMPPMMPPLAPSQDTSRVTVKATYGNDMIKFELPPTSGIIELKEEVAMRLKLKLSSFKLKYEDEDGDWILLTCDKDLGTYLQLFSSMVKPVIRLLVDKVAKRRNRVGLRNERL